MKNRDKTMSRSKLYFQHMNFPDDRSAKPPYSYAALICLAMATTEQKMTLNQIYIWIKEQFAYYRFGDQCWQVNIG